MKALLWIAFVLVIVGGAAAVLGSVISLVGEIVGDPLAQARQRPTVITGALVAVLGGLLAVVPVVRGTYLR